jgi:glutaminyl-tRNA synthetase
LLTIQNPAELEDWLGDLNPHSKEVIKDAYAVPSLATAVLGDKFQFERLGNFKAEEPPIQYVIQLVFTTQLIVLI